MSAVTRLQGLYVLTDANLSPPAELCLHVEQAILGGARIVQYRDKHSDQATRLQQASALQALCKQHGVCFIVNDDVELAQTVQADGVHLGRDDIPIEQARARLGNDTLIGISCYNKLDRAIQAASEGADYVAFGSFFDSAIKPNAVKAGLDLLRQARREITLPIAAIGGISQENAGALLDAGADMLAVISAVFSEPDVRQAANSFAELFNQAKVI